MIYQFYNLKQFCIKVKNFEHIYVYYIFSINAGLYPDSELKKELKQLK